jgi:tetratricopeptide (TPR) repeat protein
MNRSVFFIILSLFFIPLNMPAQTVDNVLDQVTAALEQSHWQEADNLYRIAVDVDVFRSERYLNDKVQDNSPARPSMLMYLGDYFRRTRNYDDAYSYYKKLVAANPKDINYLLRLSEMEVQLGKESDALITYQSIYNIDENNLSANIFLGNYYFCEAEKQMNELYNEHQKTVNPTRIQLSAYHDQKVQIYNTNYKRSKKYLETASKRFPSAEVFKTLKKIQHVEDEIQRNK